MSMLRRLWARVPAAERALLRLGLLAWILKIARHAGAPAWPLTLALVAASLLAAAAAWRRRERGWLDGPRLVLVLLGLWLLPSVYGALGGDGIQYYILLRSPLLDRDLDFDNDFAGLSAAPVVSVQGESTSRMPIGTALFWSPVFLVVHAVLKVGQWIGLGGPADGFGPAYAAAVATTTYVFVFAALLLLESALRARHGRAVALLAVAGIWLGTPLAFYTTAAATMSHGASACLAILFVLAWLRARESQAPSPWAWAGLAGGLMAAVRPQDAVLLALPVLDALWQRRWRAVLPFLAGPAAFGLLQLLVWLRLYGADFAGVVSGQSYVGHTPLYPLELMFSARHGLFTWTPLYLAAPLGWLVLARREARLAALFGLGFTLAVLVNSAMQDWWGSESFGQRRMLGVTPLFAFGLAEALGFLRRRPLVMLAGATAVLVLWNGQLAVLYNSRWLAPRTEALSLDRMGQGQVELLYRRLLGWEERLPPRLFVLLYENLRGVWLDEGARALGETLDLGRQSDGSLEPPDLHALLVDGWYGADREGDTAFRRCRGQKARLRVPIRTPGPFEVTLRARSEMGPAPLRVALEVNGERVGEEALTAAWSEADFAVPERLLRPGFNDFVLVFSATPREADPAHEGRNSPAAVDWVRLHRQQAREGPR
jgi:hypothetical protein